MNKTIVLGVLAVVILAGAGWYFWVKQSTESQDASTPIGIDTGAPLLSGENAIYVADQLPSTNVMVNMIVFEKPGFVVIHESSEGKPGTVIGTSAHLSSGEHTNVPINLSRISRDGEELFAMLHADNGDTVWSSVSDVPVQDHQGNIIMIKFAVKNDASAPADVKF